MKSKKLNLSPRQTEILRLIANGNTDKAIAGELGISENTVKAQIKRIFQRLHSSSRAQAVMQFFGK
jgi:two-component system NarL family response regulator